MGPEAISQIYASDIVSGFDIHKPEKMNVLFSKYGDQGASYFQLLRSMGFVIRTLRAAEANSWMPRPSLGMTGR